MCHSMPCLDASISFDMEVHHLLHISLCAASVLQEAHAVVEPRFYTRNSCPFVGSVKGHQSSSLQHEEQPGHEGPSDEERILLKAIASRQHGEDSSVASEPDVAHLLLEAAREANADLARDAETDANMLEVNLPSANLMTVISSDVCCKLAPEHGICMVT